MKKRIVNKTTTKLKNNSGVTILFALLAFLVASVVSVIIVGNASSSVKRTHSISESAQYNLTLDSAATLLKKNIDGYSLTVQGTRTAPKYPVENDVFSEELDTISNAYINGTSEPSGSFTITVENHEPVTVNYKSSNGTTADKHIVTFKLQTNSSNVMYVTFNVEVIESTQGTSPSKEAKWSFDNCSGKDKNDVFTN